MRNILLVSQLLFHCFLKAKTKKWGSEEHELDDIYYYNIRLGIEKRAYELDYEMLRFFNDIPSNLEEGVIGVLCIGKFSREQIAELERLKKTLVFVDSDTLNQGHPCVTTDFENSVQTPLCYLREQGCNSIGLLTGQEKTTDATEIIPDPRLRSYRNYCIEKGIYDPLLVLTGDFTVQSGYELLVSKIMFLMTFKLSLLTILVLLNKCIPHFQVSLSIQKK